MEEGVDPKGPKAPKTMYDAVDKFYDKLNGGKIINQDAQALLNFSRKNLIIGITGTIKANPGPCFTFADNGLGQKPDDFPDTFLSFSAKNKSDIPFVQGKYNMGSSGVHKYCGENKYKLIVSRRYDKKSPWGWTLVRQCPQSYGGNIYLEYFVPNKSIPIISKDTIYPFQTQDNKEYKKIELETGTIIKLYDYYVGRDYKGFRGTREAMIENLVETILPFRIMDFRWPLSPGRDEERSLGIDSRPFYGMEYLLCRTHGEMLDDLPDGDGNQEGDEIKPELIEQIKSNRWGKITISALLLKRSKNNKRKGWYQKSRARIFHHVNGQTMFKDTRGILSQSCKLPNLKDRVAIFVDCSNMSETTHADLWKGDRENIHETHLGEEYKQLIRDAIKQSNTLKQWDEKILKEDMELATQDNVEVLKHLIRDDKNLQHLLQDTFPTGVWGKESGDVPPDADDINRPYSPTEIEFKERTDNIKEVPLKNGRMIPLKTDAKNDYLTRPKNQGQYYFIKDGKEDNALLEKIDTHANINRGIFMLSIRPIIGRANMGDRFRFKVALTDDAMPQKSIMTKDEITIKIIDSRPPQPAPPQTPPQTLNLPRCIWLTREGKNINDAATKKWEETDFGCDEHTGGMISGEKENKICYINYDNIWFSKPSETQ